MRCPARTACTLVGQEVYGNEKAGTHIAYIGQLHRLDTKAKLLSEKKDLGSKCSDAVNLVGKFIYGVYCTEWEECSDEISIYCTQMKEDNESSEISALNLVGLE